ncbi:hypothetical protein C9374_004712 [Naegleria lovaniensis]|uniref:Uncharacterized protein n=1 Tax=Naegleria lovaniensis TaxID=51637 RepID=A0AA88KL85_NAELO|nr:uncharacterized protein C9374_004712 [Naegleria lovaniensis]KAG2383375.1 hypothetical protein C9374_004712 [Naegleria lovaniensis]
MAKRELYYTESSSSRQVHLSTMMTTKNSYHGSDLSCDDNGDSLMCTSPPTSPSLLVEHYVNHQKLMMKNQKNNTNKVNTTGSFPVQPREILADITPQVVAASTSRLNGQGASLTSTTTINTCLKATTNKNYHVLQQGQSMHMTSRTGSSHYYHHSLPSTSTFPHNEMALSYSSNNATSNTNYTHNYSATGKTNAAVYNHVGHYSTCCQKTASKEPQVFSPSVASPVLDFGEFQMMQDDDDEQDNEEPQLNDQDGDYLFCKDVDEQVDTSDDDYSQHYFTSSQDNYPIKREAQSTSTASHHHVTFNNNTMNSSSSTNSNQTQRDPDLLDAHDRMRLKQALDNNVDHPVNLLPKFNSKNQVDTLGRIPVEVEQDVLTYLFENENRKQPSLDALRSTQTIVTPDMLSMLIEWLAGICVGFKLRPETYYSSVNILDRFLCQYRVESTKFLQGIGLASLLVAAKFCEITCPPLKQLLFAADNFYTRRAILDWESEICNILDFEFCTVHAFDFIEKFLEICGYAKCDQVRMLAYFICELQLQNFNTLQFQRHTVAICSIIIALHMFQQPFLTPNVLYCVRLSESFFAHANGSLTSDDLQLLETTNRCLLTMFNFYIGMISGHIKYHFVVDKYSKDSFMNVATWFLTNDNINNIPPQINLHCSSNVTTRNL